MHILPGLFAPKHRDQQGYTYYNHNSGDEENQPASIDAQRFWVCGVGHVVEGVEQDNADDVVDNGRGEHNHVLRFAGLAALHHVARADQRGSHADHRPCEGEPNNEQVEPANVVVKHVTPLGRDVARHEGLCGVEHVTIATAPIRGLAEKDIPTLPVILKRSGFGNESVVSLKEEAVCCGCQQHVQKAHGQVHHNSTGLGLLTHLLFFGGVPIGSLSLNITKNSHKRRGASKKQFQHKRDIGCF